MAEQETKRDSSARVQIIVAVIGLVGVVTTALISNWSNIFSRKPPQPTPAATSPAMPGSGTPPKKSERPIHSSGRLTIGPTRFYDLDTGTEQPDGADFLYEHKFGEVKDWFLAPQNGAVFYVVGPTQFESVTWSDMERFPYSTEKIIATEGPSNQIPAGTVVAYKTNEGRLGKFIVDKTGFGYTIRWRTYD